jgi:LemA family protein
LQYGNQAFPFIAFLLINLNIVFYPHLFTYFCSQNRIKSFLSMTGIIILVVVVLLVIWGVSIYNNLVKLRNNRENAFANIDVQLKQRHDLVPQLVATVKGYADHEKEVFMRVTEARSAAMSASSIDDKISAENALTSALAGLKVSLEAYPELKANQNFLQLQNELSDIENKLAAVRRFFNSTTRELNNAVQTFPSNLFAGMFGFKKEPMFEIPTEQRTEFDKAPEVKF